MKVLSIGSLFGTMAYIILTKYIQINVYMYQKKPSLLHLGRIQVPLGTIHNKIGNFLDFLTPPHTWPERILRSKSSK